MDHYDIKRLALVLALQAEIEAMKIYNLQNPDTTGYGEGEFWNRAEQLKEIANKHNEQL